MTAIVLPTLTARIDKRLSAILDEVTMLTYAGGGSRSDDVPPHVRAASAIRRFGGRLAIVQDDVNVLALRDQHGELHPLLLPLGPGGRRVFDDLVGNRHLKMDLEACVTLPDGRLLAFGSGSSPARDVIVVVTRDGVPKRLRAPHLYATLRAESAFSGAGLNIEGALVKEQELLLFQRGNAAPRGRVAPVNAIGRLDLGHFLRYCDEGAPAPRLSSVMPVDLGEVAGVKLGFTDAALCADGRIAILACAEDSPDAIRDGPVVGCRVGLLDGHELRMTDILDENGMPVTLKLEGIESRPGRELAFDVVADMDRPAEPARAACLRIREAIAKKPD